MSGVSRRHFLKSAGSLVAVDGVARSARTRAAGGTVLAYVGTYSDHGEGIHLLRQDAATGNLTRVKVFPSPVNPSWIALSADGRFLYSANEISNFEGGTSGSVTAYAIDKANGHLTAIGTVTSGGAGPAHLSVDPRGRYVFVANYGGGSVAVIPVRPDGSLGAPTDIVNDASACSPPCRVGPARAEKGPRGNFSISGHDAPHAHMILADPSGDYIVVNDLGLDRTIVWSLDRAAGKLKVHNTAPSSAGAGPRHFVFHPNGRWFYSVNEQASTVAFMHYDTGRLRLIDEVSTLPRGFAGTNFTSEIAISPDGRYVYAANRLHDTIAIFLVGSDGRLRYVREEWTRGDYPRSFAFDPAGRFLYSCNHRGDSITVYTVGERGRSLSFAGHYVAVGSPACIVFLQV
jgi:6-phosphogluconolactonase